MKVHKTRICKYTLIGWIAVFVAWLAGCDSAAYHGQVQQPTYPTEEREIVIEESSYEEEVLEGISRLTPEGPEYEILKELPIPETDPVGGT